MRKSKIMKALLVFGMSAVTATSIVGFAACDSGNGGGEGGGEGGSNGHVHSWSDWTDDGNGSTHSRTCSADGHEGNAKETQDHADTNGDGKCDVCNYVFHVHDWATDYTNTDINKHYIECLASGHPAGEYKNEGSHVDEDLDGDCDVCGYGYNIPEKFTQLLNQEGATKVVANTFVTSGTLPEFSNWGTAGVYQARKGTTTAATHYVNVENGIGTLVTTADGATYMPVDLGSVSGNVVEGYFEITAVNGTATYTPVQFVSVSGSTETEVFGLRSSTNWGYRLDGGSAVTPAGFTETWATGGKVYFKFDTASNKLTVTINDVPFVTDLQLSNRIDGIKFSSGDSNTATYAVDNVIVIKTPLDVSVYKTAVSANAVAAKALIANGITVNDTEAKSAFDTALNAAETTADCDAAYNTYYAALLTGYKSGVTDKIANDYPSTSYSTVGSNKEDYEAAVGALSTALDSANTLEKVTAAYDTANSALGEIKDDNYYAKADVVVTVTPGKADGNTLTVKVGDTVEKADLDALVEIPSGKSISGYSDANVEVTFPYTVNASVTLTATFVEKVVNSTESFSTVAGSEAAASTQTFAANDVITTNTLFTITAQTDMLYSVGKSYGQINTGSNAASYTNLAGQTISPDQGIKLTSAVNAGATVESAFTVTASENITLKLYITWCNDSYNSNKSGRILYQVNGGTVTETADLTARKTISVLTIELNAGDVLTVGGKNTHTDTGKVWFFGAEATLKA
ncbi:MAG: hypothetical protein K2O89_03650 [Clostridia bacterium]|nr:hypothetical protein [Clostridia bacterium]